MSGRRGIETELWYWPGALALFILAWVIPLIAILIKGTSPAELSKTGPSYFLVGLFWWIKKALGFQGAAKRSAK